MAQHPPVRPGIDLVGIDAGWLLVGGGQGVLGQLAHDPILPCRLGAISTVFTSNMHAAYAARIDADDPLAALEVGERPDPTPPDGWVVVE